MANNTNWEKIREILIKVNSEVDSFINDINSKPPLKTEEFHPVMKQLKKILKTGDKEIRDYLSSDDDPDEYGITDFCLSFMHLASKPDLDIETDFGENIEQFKKISHEKQLYVLDFLELNTKTFSFCDRVEDLETDIRESIQRTFNALKKISANLRELLQG